VTKAEYVYVASALVVGFGIGDILAAVTAPEYMLALATPDKPGIMIGVVVVGLNKRQAEGAAVQLNETFKQRSIPVVVSARPQVDIGNYHPK
jgi:uncharacterized membrane-anchored protein YhcB (DUF1043 family)